MLIAAGTVLGSIPSPPFNIIHLGPLPLRMYGLCIALGVVAAVMISSKRWERRGGNPDDIGTIAIWAVPAGVVGARMYHVATDWKKYTGSNWPEAFNITRGGLGIPGGVAAGVLVGLLVVRKNKWPALPLLDMVAPAIPVGQAIGRLGNWFNQELFGRPTTLPWGLKIDAEHAATAGYTSAGTFHPTFLYEGLWNLALAGLLIRLDRSKKLRPGELFTLYVLGYSIGRLWVEEMRSDPASLLLGIRVNVWMSVTVALVAVVIFARNRRRPLTVDRFGNEVGTRRAIDAHGVEIDGDDIATPGATDDLAAARPSSAPARSGGGGPGDANSDDPPDGGDASPNPPET